MKNIDVVLKRQGERPLKFCGHKISSCREGNDLVNTRYEIYVRSNGSLVGYIQHWHGMTSSKKPYGTLVGHVVNSNGVDGIRRFFGRCGEEFARSHGFDGSEYLVDAAATAIADAIEALDIEATSH